MCISILFILRYISRKYCKTVSTKYIKNNNNSFIFTKLTESVKNIEIKMKKENILKQILEMLDKHYLENEIYEPIISELVQQNEIDNLKKTVRYEQFFFVLNIIKRKIEHVHGVAEWLGYADSKFSFYDYIKIIHPRHLPSLNMLADSAFKTANSNEFTLKFMEHRIVVQVPLLNANGNYILTKRTLYPFQIDRSGKVLAYLNHFVILKEYNEQDTLTPRVGNDFKLNSAPEFFSVKSNQPKITLSDKKPFGFNKTELAILLEIVNNSEITQKEISQHLNISLDTLRKTYNRRILSKARESFGIESFSTIKDVALYLKTEGYL